jgi:hypothetical protein
VESIYKINTISTGKLSKIGIYYLLEGDGNMPWKKIPQNRNMEVYKETLGELIKDSKDIDTTIMGMLIRTELLKHDFTKRQINVISLIFTFSFAYGKESAYIPKLQDFGIAGVGFKKVREELDKLLKMNVITWNKEENLFSINNPLLWRNVPRNKAYDEDRLRQLFMLNLEHYGIDITPIVEKINAKKDH